jgi:beta-galactosidase
VVELPSASVPPGAGEAWLTVDAVDGSGLVLGRGQTQLRAAPGWVLAASSSPPSSAVGGASPPDVGVLPRPDAAVVSRPDSAVFPRPDDGVVSRPGPAVFPRPDAGVLPVADPAALSPTGSGIPARSGAGPSPWAGARPVGAGGASAPRWEGGVIRLGEGVFEPVHGRLARLGDLALRGPVLDVWRAPIDNDRLGPDPVADRWRAAGLHRMTHRLLGVELTDDALVVATRVAAAASDRGLLTWYDWRHHDDALQLTVRVEPTGDWDVPLPRLGVHLELPPDLGAVAWFGAGPGEAYPDSRTAALIGRYESTVDGLATPYVFPQENGNRADARWLTLTGPDGGGLRVEGVPRIDFTARRWPPAALDEARHHGDLVATDRIHLHLDHAHHGLGSAACGPGVLPQYVLTAAPATFTVVLRRLP